MKIRTINKGLLAGIAALALSGVSAQAEIIYTEVFNNTSGGNEALSAGYGGFTGYRDDGTDFTGSTGDPLTVNQNGFIFIGSGAANQGDSYALLSGAGSVDPTAYQNDLTIAFNSNSTDANPANAEMGWRVLATVGSTIYASDLIGITSVEAVKSVVVSDAAWHVWTSETDLTDGFNIANIDGGAGINLAAGSISDIGVLAIDGAAGNDRMRFRDFTISGTVVPEPATIGLVAAFGGGILFIRRRFMI